MPLHNEVSQWNDGNKLRRSGWVAGLNGSRIVAYRNLTRIGDGYSRFQDCIRLEHDYANASGWALPVVISLRKFSFMSTPHAPEQSP